MTGRERLTAVLNRQPTDRLAWTTLVDEHTLALATPPAPGMTPLDFYRRIGCDIFQLNGWGTPHELRSPEPLWPDGVRMVTTRDGFNEQTRWESAYGSLTAIRRNGHPVKYPVDSIEAVGIYRQIWEGVRFRAWDDTVAMTALDRLVGHDGVVTRFWGPSTIPRLLEEDMGTENFYYLMADAPDEMHGLIETIHHRELEAFDILGNGPWHSVTLVENTSTAYISPEVYRQYNMPHQRRFVEIMHSKGKVAILHMCGHVHALLDLIRETGCDGIHTLTPPPTGNTPWEAALDALGEDLIIFGCLDPSIFAAGPVSQIPHALDRLITPRLRESPFVLNPMADGIPVPQERFLAISRWIERHGKR